MEVYIEFEGKQELLNVNIDKVRLSKGFPIGFMIKVNEEEFNDLFEEK